MQVVVNGAYVRSRVKIGNIAHWASMALLIVGLILSFTRDALGQESIFYAYVALILALLLLNFGRTFTRRWGPRFRQDQWLIPGLRGVDNKHVLFNYPARGLPDHLLVGPTGFFLLVPKPQGGKIRFDGRRWSRGSIGGGLLRNIAEGGLGNPLADARRAMSMLATYLTKHGSEDLVKELEVRPIIVFTNPQVELEVRNSQVPVVQMKELRAIFRRAKPVLPQEKVDELKQVLGREVQS